MSIDSDGQFWLSLWTLLFAFILAVCGLIVYSVKASDQAQTNHIRVCVQSGGQWVLANETDRYSPFVCARG